MHNNMDTSPPGGGIPRPRRGSTVLENGSLFTYGDKAEPPIFQSASGMSTPIPLPDVYTQPAHKYPGLDSKHNSTGVIWATEQATAKGYHPDDPAWTNFGQGAPEVGPIPGGMEKPQWIESGVGEREYAPTSGVKELREAVANLYNDHYRKGMESQYTYENVCIVPGGRAGLIRIASILRDCYMSFFLPDYTAYSEMLSLFKNFAAIPVPLEESDNYQVHLDAVANELRRGVTAMITSNPRNPTGHSIKGEGLEKLHDMCRQQCLLIMDEFYSRYYYDSNCDGSSNSSAQYVQDVNVDPVLILDGLTKAFRLPGWRVCWVLGPKKYIEALTSAGSYLDGGTNAPFQKAAIPMLEPNLVRNEMAAVQTHFKAKRDYCIQRLEAMGFHFRSKPDSTFYLWLDLSHLPGKIKTALGFFQECLNERIITVPGIFFDLNPVARRELHDSPMFHFVRLSYGPPMDQLKQGMDGIQRIVDRYKAGASILPKR
jgi:aspartate/methionine/tyrosine aminotransferase